MSHPPRLTGTTGASSGSPIALTADGRRELEAEVRRLRGEHLVDLAARLAEARDDAAARDEDAGLLELHEEYYHVQRRLLDLERLLATAREVAPPADGRVALGSRVEVEDGGAREAFQLVDPHEANPAEGRISTACPVGQALLGRRVGEEVVVPLPAGERRLRIVALS